MHIAMTWSRRCVRQYACYHSLFSPFIPLLLLELLTCYVTLPLHHSLCSCSFDVFHLALSQRVALIVSVFLCLFTFSRCNHIKYARISGCNMCTPSEWMNVYVIYVARNHRAHRQLETIANTMCGMFGAIAKFYTMVTVNTQSGEVLCNLQFLPMQASDIIRSDWNGMYTK